MQVLVAILIGIVPGHVYPALGEQMKPLGDGFIKLVKMIIAPVIFLTIVAGIAKIGDLRHVGKIGLKALIYFEVQTTLALVIGLVVANLVRPGAGMGIARAITNFIGNGVATMVVAEWEGLRDDDKMRAAFAAGPEPTRLPILRDPDQGD